MGYLSFPSLGDIPANGNGLGPGDLPEDEPGHPDPGTPDIPVPGENGVPVTRDDIDGQFRIRLTHARYPGYAHMVDYWVDQFANHGATWWGFINWLDANIGQPLPLSENRADQPVPTAPPPGDVPQDEGAPGPVGPFPTGIWLALGLGAAYFLFFRNRSA